MSWFLMLHLLLLTFVV